MDVLTRWGILSIVYKGVFGNENCYYGSRWIYRLKSIGKLADYDEIDILALSRVQMIEHSIIK